MWLVKSRIGSLLILALLVAFAGCAGIGSTGPDVTDKEAREQALSAEETRVTQALGNASYVTSSSVGIYAEPNATVLNSNSSAVKIRVKMPYSYEYSCEDGSSGAVDGLKTNVVYQVTDSNVTVMTITERIQNACA
ncbi:hypothetical protein SAMN05192561_1185 [Halopenitus malekzadehii]|uniref:Uncharacterized protein n=1 Tax=Halopenitus malekzadehii TaxID=1267564 RepID=A0A1H6JNK8_9EURY|nr:hypothetical protein SAMN05192561_1185 [Halopenitus malekzadehii]